MNRIQKWSNRIRVFFQIVLIGIPIGAIFQWVIYDGEALSLLNGLRYRHLDLPIVQSIPYSSRWLCFGIAMIKNAVTMFGFYHLIKLFKLYEKGQIFTLETIREMKICAYSVFGWCIAKFFTSILLILALTFHNPKGQRILAVSFDATDFSTLVIGIITIITVQIMDEARMLKEEHDYII